MVKVIIYFWLWVNIFLVYYTISYSKIILLTQNRFVVYIIKKMSFFKLQRVKIRSNLVFDVYINSFRNYFYCNLNYKKDNTIIYFQIFISNFFKNIWNCMFYHIFHTMVLQTCIDNSLKHPNLSIMEDF